MFNKQLLERYNGSIPDYVLRLPDFLYEHLYENTGTKCDIWYFLFIQEQQEELNTAVRQDLVRLWYYDKDYQEANSVLIKYITSQDICPEDIILDIINNDCHYTNVIEILSYNKVITRKTIDAIFDKLNKDFTWNDIEGDNGGFNINEHCESLLNEDEIAKIVIDCYEQKLWHVLAEFEYLSKCPQWVKDYIDLSGK